MMADQEAPVAAESTTDRLAENQSDLAGIKAALKARDWSNVDIATGSAPSTMGVDVDALSQPSIARQILVTRRRLLELEGRVEQMCDDPVHRGRELLADHGLKPNREGLKPPMTLSHSIQKAAAVAPDSVDLPVAALGAAVEDKGAFGVLDQTTDRTSSLEALALFAGGVGVSLDSPSLTADFIESAHAHGLEVHGWTFRPKSIEEARARFDRYFAMGMGGAFTDYPDLAVQVRAEFTESIR